MKERAEEYTRITSVSEVNKRGYRIGRGTTDIYIYISRLLIKRLVEMERRQQFQLEKEKSRLSIREKARVARYSDAPRS